MSEEVSQFKPIGTMTRKRYNEIKEFIEGKYDAEVSECIMETIRNVLKFDPNKSIYTKELGQKIFARRKEKSAETGISLYVLSGAKKCYEKKKNAKILKDEE